MTRQVTWKEMPIDIHRKIINSLTRADASSVMATCVEMRDLVQAGDTWSRAGGTDYKNFTTMMTCISAVAVPSLQRAMKSMMRQPGAPWLSVAVHEALRAGTVPLAPFRDANYLLAGFHTSLTDEASTLLLQYVHRVHGRMGEVTISTDLANGRSKLWTCHQTSPLNAEGTATWSLPYMRHTGPSKEPYLEYLHESPEQWFGPEPTTEV